MAKREEEEAELRVPETMTLCANNCGFHGSPATKNMCQSCFQAAARDGLSCSGHDRPRSPPIRPAGPAEVAGGEGRAGTEAERAPAGAVSAAPGRPLNRCARCRRRVGLTAFRCRCGEMFCAEHRYTDRHVCSYDYKTAGRAAIARENPVVRAAKIVRV